MNCKYLIQNAENLENWRMRKINRLNISTLSPQKEEKNQASKHYISNSEKILLLCASIFITAKERKKKETGEKNTVTET